MKKINIIVDIDGTISNQDKRVHFLTQDEKDWDSYFQACDMDTPIKDIINLVLILEETFDITYCTGRTEEVRAKTERWLEKNVYNSDYEQNKFDSRRLLMRKKGDVRHEMFFKPDLLTEANISLNSIAYIIEDRDSMVKTWRDLGLTVLQPNYGDF